MRLIRSGLLAIVFSALVSTSSLHAQPSDLTLFTNASVQSKEGSTAFAGESHRITPTGPVILGQGFSLLSYAPRDSAVVVNGTTVEERPELLLHYNFELIDSYEELSQSLQIDAAASAHYLAGSASARMSLLQSSKVTNQSVYVLVSMRVTNVIRQLNTFTLTNDALLRAANGSGPFYSNYGDGFIHRVGFGSELYALLEIQSKTQRSRQDVRAEVEASYAAFQANGSISSAIEQISNNNHVKVYYSQSGANVGDDVTTSGSPPVSSGGVLVLNENELILRVRKFTKEARDNPKNAELIWADVIDYSACRNKPTTFTPFSTDYAVWTLSDLGHLYLQMRQLADSWDEYLQSKNKFAAPSTNARVPTPEDISLLQDLMKRLQRTSSYISVNPGKAATPEIESILKLRVLTEAARRLAQDPSSGSPGTAAFLAAIDHRGSPAAVPEAVPSSSCLSRDSAVTQLACLLQIQTPVSVGEAFASANVPANVHRFKDPVVVTFPNDFVDPTQTPEVFIDLSPQDGTQFDFGHNAPVVTPTGFTFQICFRPGNVDNPNNDCLDYGDVTVRWVAHRKAHP